MRNFVGIRPDALEICRLDAKFRAEHRIKQKKQRLLSKEKKREWSAPRPARTVSTVEDIGRSHLRALLLFSRLEMIPEKNKNGMHWRPILEGGSAGTSENKHLWATRPRVYEQVAQDLMSLGLIKKTGSVTSKGLEIIAKIVEPLDCYVLLHSNKSWSILCGVSPKNGWIEETENV